MESERTLIDILERNARHDKIQHSERQRFKRLTLCVAQTRNADQLQTSL